MLTYKDTAIVFRELPDEVTLAINIAGCPVHCPGCHSPHLWDNDGISLTNNTLDELIKSNPGITCTCFMGGDGDVHAVGSLVKYVRNTYPWLKISWWSGREQIPDFVNDLDYLKLGPYIKVFGGLDSPETNQKLYRIVKQMPTNTQTTDGSNDRDVNICHHGLLYMLEDINELKENEI